MIRYILLARHGDVDHDSNLPDREQKLKCGGPDIKQIAKTLADFLAVQPEIDPVVISEIWHGTYKHTQETARIIHNALEQNKLTAPLKQMRHCTALDPDHFFRAATVDKRRQVAK